MQLVNHTNNDTYTKTINICCLYYISGIIRPEEKLNSISLGTDSRIFSISHNITKIMDFEVSIFKQALIQIKTNYLDY